MIKVKQKTDDEIEINEIEPSSQNNKKIRRFSNYVIKRNIFFIIINLIIIIIKQAKLILILNGIYIYIYL